MKTIMSVVAVTLLFTAVFASAQDGTTKDKSTNDGGSPAGELKRKCDQYIIGQANGKDVYDSPLQHIEATVCFNYIAGVIDEASGETFFLSADHKKLGWGTWQNVSVDQVIRVFVRYVIANPEKLNKKASSVMLDAGEESKLYIIKPI